MSDAMTPLRLHEEPLQDAWLDAYGHLNEAYYLVPFSNATWALQDHFGIGTAYFDQTKCALYTLETHLRYVDEVRAPATLKVESMVLGVDKKRLHVGHNLIVDGRERATFECMLLHYDTGAGSSAPFPDDKFAEILASRFEPQPDWVGKSVRSLI